MQDKIEITENKVVINGKTYVPENSQKSPNYSGPIKIVVLQRGWVYIGRFERTEMIVNLTTLIVFAPGYNKWVARIS